MNKKKNTTKKKNQTKKKISSRGILKIILIYIFIVSIFLLISKVIIDNVEERMNQKIRDICEDPYIQYRSCDDLSFAKEYCDTAETQYNDNNCS